MFLLNNTRARARIEQLNRLPVVQNLMILHPAPSSFWSRTAMYVFPIGLVIWAFALLFEARTVKSVKEIVKLIPAIETDDNPQNPS